MTTTEHELTLAVQLDDDTKWFLLGGGYASVEEWALDSDFHRDASSPTGWSSDDGGAWADIEGAVEGAMESVEAYFSGPVDPETGGITANLVPDDEFQDEDEPFTGPYVPDQDTDGPMKGQVVKAAYPQDGVAFFIKSDDGEGNLLGIMLGDNQPVALSADDCTLIAEDEFCPGCGQIDCGHYR